MRFYEGLFVFPPETTPEGRKGEEKILEDMIQKLGGSVVQKTEYGKKPLGYAVRKFHEGRFLLCDFQLPPGKMNDLKKALQLYEGLLHFMITVKDKKLKKKTGDGTVGTEEAVARVPSSSAL